ncbi:MAG: AglZ/HisF2 family acetamidino modification protein [Qipengyuania sp.]|nr:AglZ/HisF2 family acetamidino modification protein [Qipengyuania sp.]
MLRPRIIPTLLIHDGGLVKTVRFDSPKYVGDPINAVKIFNEKDADELFAVDIDATALNHEPDYRLIENLAAECRMPLCYGGGITTVEQAEHIISLGVEKVALSKAAIDDPTLVTRIAERLGRQSVVAVIDIKRNSTLFHQSEEVVTVNARIRAPVKPLDIAKRLEEAGVGEIVINSVDRDGMQQGYDLELARKFREQLGVPLTVLGGAGSLDDVEELIAQCGLVGAAAGSLFVFKGARKAVLINYPDMAAKAALCRKGLERHQQGAPS